jgi:uncharacterized protein
MKFVIYRDVRREWRWRVIARNGNIMGDSGEGYKRRQSAEKAIASIQKNAAKAKVEYYRPKVTKIEYL